MAPPRRCCSSWDWRREAPGKGRGCVCPPVWRRPSSCSFCICLRLLSTGGEMQLSDTGWVDSNKVLSPRWCRGPKPGRAGVEAPVPEWQGCGLPCLGGQGCRRWPRVIHHVSSLSPPPHLWLAQHPLPVAWPSGPCRMLQGSATLPAQVLCWAPRSPCSFTSSERALAPGRHPLSALSSLASLERCPPCSRFRGEQGKHVLCSLTWTRGAHRSFLGPVEALWCFSSSSCLEEQLHEFCVPLIDCLELRCTITKAVI